MFRLKAIFLGSEYLDDDWFDEWFYLRLKKT